MRRRPPAVAGTFYPAHAAALLDAVTTLLDRSDAPAPARALGAIAPHAGYVYSGHTAGTVFAALDVPARVVILAPNHTGDGDAPHGGSILAGGVFGTPMGDVTVDHDLAAMLLEACPYLSDDPAAHRREHAVEVELPFLLARRPDVRIVPIVLAWNDWPKTRALGDALAAVVERAGEPVLLLASSDMNHYEDAGVTMAKDALAIREVERLDGEALLDVTRRHKVSMCGRVPAAAVAHAARALGARDGALLEHTHSGEVNGDHARVVGYAGMVMR